MPQPPQSRRGPPVGSFLWVRSYPVFRVLPKLLLRVGQVWLLVLELRAHVGHQLDPLAEGSPK